MRGAVYDNHNVIILYCNACVFCKYIIIRKKKINTIIVLFNVLSYIYDKIKSRFF